MGQWSHNRIGQQLHKRFRRKHQSNFHSFLHQFLVAHLSLRIPAHIFRRYRSRFHDPVRIGRFLAWRQRWHVGRFVGETGQRCIGMSNVVQKLGYNGNCKTQQQQKPIIISIIINSSRQNISFNAIRDLLIGKTFTVCNIYICQSMKRL
jgi:hypothetical protein